MIAITFGFAFGACTSSRVEDRKATNLFRAGEYQKSAARLEEGLKEEGDGPDRLLYLMDLGLAYHSAGEHDKAIKTFLIADKLAEIVDYSSLAEDVSTAVISSNTIPYKGEEYEKVLINAYLAIDFAMLGKIEDSLVEARRVNRKLQRMIDEGKRKYQQSPFARYFSAVLYEGENELNSAYIDYKRSYELEPAIPMIGLDLWRTAKLLRMPDEMRRWEKQFELDADDKKEALKYGPGAPFGELVVLYENGISPAKRPNRNFRLVPSFKARFNPVHYAEVHVGDKKLTDTFILHNVEESARQNLDQKYGALVAKKAAGIVAKEAIGFGVEKATDSPLLGLLTRVALHASDRADLRSWNLLPRDLQMARIPLEPGEHKVQLRLIGASKVELDNKFGPDAFEKTVKITAGKKTYVNFRYTP